MPLPSPTTNVLTTLNLSLQDLLQGGSQIFTRNNTPVSFKAVNVQYQGYVNLPVSTNTTFGPIPPVTSFGIVYVRNAGANNVEVQYANTGGALTNSMNLDPGAIWLYVSPSLTSVLVGGIQSGIASFQLVTGLTTTSNVEVLAAG